jgi:hypothetical protein
MNFFKNIWKTLFGKSNKNESVQFGKTGSIAEPKLNVVHKKEDVEVKKGQTYVEHELGDPERDDIQTLKNFAVSSEIEKPKMKKHRDRDKKIVRAGKESKVKEYLEKYGSIDKETSALLFRVKRLDCMILSLRKKGLNIVSKDIELTNENGEKTKVNNYVLVNSDGAN